MALNVKNLTKRIKNKDLVKNVTFTVEAGTIVGLLGPNGAGKTTTMKAIMGLTSFQQGDVTIYGKSITTHFEGVIRKIGGIIETPGFYPSLTGNENLIYYAKLSKCSIHDVKDITTKLGLTQVLKKK
ncbi:hypothetical protein J6TS7_54120 [Paenibacillus dendritiformis]|nr:hypothetical protein J6TS7_54120 [Paenibacillus dendritiformis]